MLSWLCKILKRDEWLVEDFDSKDGPRWRIRARNGEVVATSEAYSSKYERDESVRRLVSVRLVTHQK